MPFDLSKECLCETVSDSLSGRGIEHSHLALPEAGDAETSNGKHVRAALVISGHWPLALPPELP